MNIINKIFLVGMPASGKSYWAALLAQYFNVAFIDLDNAIENTAQNTISNLFLKDENYFREIESITLQYLIGNITKPTIFATGGGTPVYHHNMQLMNKNGLTVYIKSSIQHIMAHIDTAHRNAPLLKNKLDEELEYYLTELLAEREPFYQQAQIIVDGNTISLPTFATILQTYINP